MDYYANNCGIWSNFYCENCPDDSKTDIKDKIKKLVEKRRSVKYTV